MPTGVADARESALWRVEVFVLLLFAEQDDVTMAEARNNYISFVQEHGPNATFLAHKMPAMQAVTEPSH